MINSSLFYKPFRLLYFLESLQEAFAELFIWLIPPFSCIQNPHICFIYCNFECAQPLILIKNPDFSKSSSGNESILPFYHRGRFEFYILYSFSLVLLFSIRSPPRNKKSAGFSNRFSPFHTNGSIIQAKNILSKLMCSPILYNK